MTILKTLITSLEPGGKFCIIELSTRDGKLNKCNWVKLLPFYNDIQPITAAEDKYIVDLPPYILHINHVYFENIHQDNTDVEKNIPIVDDKISFKIFKKDPKQVISIKLKKTGNCYCILIKTLL
jgi:hypothetical protein